MNSICLNGHFLPANQPALLPDNRGFRYGDGLFETMRMVNGKIPLAGLHFKRLFSGLHTLAYVVPPDFTFANVTGQISELTLLNKVQELGKIRLSVFRGNGALGTNTDNFGYLIEAVAADPALLQLNTTGLSVDVFTGARKMVDAYANLKTSSFLIYSMAGLQARKSGHDDCIVMNSHGRLADASIANIFLVRNNLVITPALTEGVVDGVMRRYLIDRISQSTSLELREGVVTRSDLEVFDELFLTNAVTGLRWVGTCGRKKYSSSAARKIYDDYISPLNE